MKKVVLSLICILGVSTGSYVQAATMVYDGFAVPGDYADGENLSDVAGDGGTGWTGDWTQLQLNSPFDGRIEASATGLTYNPSGSAALLTTTGGATRINGSFKRDGRNFSTTDVSGKIFFSALYQANAGNANDTAFTLAQGSGTARYSFLADENENLRIQVNVVNGPAPVVYTTSNIDISTGPVLIVGELNITAANDDQLNFYFNPTDLANPAGSAVESFSILENNAIFDDGGAAHFFTGIGAVHIGSTSQGNQWDEFRLSYGTGAAITDVTPVIPEPSTAALLGLGALTLFLRRRSR